MDELLDKIIVLFETHLKAPLGLKEVFYGDPITIGKSSLPAIAVSPDSTIIERGDSVHDSGVLQIAISVMCDSRGLLNKNFKNKSTSEKTCSNG